MDDVCIFASSGPAGRGEELCIHSTLKIQPLNSEGSANEKLERTNDGIIEPAYRCMSLQSNSSFIPRFV